MLLIIADYMLRAVRVFSRKWKVTTAVPILDTSGQPIACTFGMTNGNSIVSEPGQYYFICIPAISQRAWHPYSVVNSVKAP